MEGKASSSPILWGPGPADREGSPASRIPIPQPLLLLHGGKGGAHHVSGLLTTHLLCVQHCAGPWWGDSGGDSELEFGLPYFELSSSVPLPPNFSPILHPVCPPPPASNLPLASYLSCFFAESSTLPGGPCVGPPEPWLLSQASFLLMELLN